MNEHSAKYVTALRLVAAGPCTREAFERLGWKSHCYHCHAIRRLAQIDGPEGRSDG